MTLITNPQAGAGTPGAGTPGAINDWRSALPDDIRSEKAFEAIKGANPAEALPALAKSYLHAQRLVGSDRVVVPNERSTPEEIAAFRQKIGVPAKHDEYGYKLPEGMDESRLDKARLDTWRKEMHEAGVPKASAERIINKFLSEEHKHHTDQAKAREDELQKNELLIKQEFGAKYDERINQARFAMRTFGNEKLSELMETTGLGSHPEVVRLFAAIGEKLADDRHRTGGAGGGGAATATPDLAQAELQRLHSDPDSMKALFNRDHPNHDAVVARRRELFEAAYPSSAPGS